MTSWVMPLDGRDMLKLRLASGLNLVYILTVRQYQLTELAHPDALSPPGSRCVRRERSLCGRSCCVMNQRARQVRSWRRTSSATAPKSPEACEACHAHTDPKGPARSLQPGGNHPPGDRGPH